MAVDTSRFISMVVNHVRRYNREIMARFFEGKLYDSKLTWWWYLYTTGRENMSKLIHELEQESRLQDTKPPRNPKVRAMLARGRRTSHHR